MLVPPALADRVCVMLVAHCCRCWLPMQARHRRGRNLHSGACDGRARGLAAHIRCRRRADGGWCSGCSVGSGRARALALGFCSSRHACCCSYQSALRGGPAPPAQCSCTQPVHLPLRCRRSSPTWWTARCVKFCELIGCCLLWGCCLHVALPARAGCQLKHPRSCLHGLAAS